ncbi:hypothetical protein [Agrobacterium sp. lyk4-40-TYG-31]|uniref:hypothetical protein n=1 Tax=Agrobacterium sp. lyk4-40-TYG-31 TaxID=3040276 RepID=UPI00254B8FBC|nr:hypothetical protein [Agrobacterium sp. lyk4-40-TYG-31]
MPNMKIYVDAGRGAQTVADIRGILQPLRSMLCRELDVDVTACQIVIVDVCGLEDQPAVNAEILLLPRPERSRERITEVCKLIREIIADATGLHVAVRSGMLDPQTYVALK